MKNLRALPPLFLLLAALLLRSPVAAAQVCEPTPPDALQFLLDQADEHLAALRTGEALNLLTEAVLRLPCLTRVVPPQQLAQVYLRLGVARRLKEDATGASDAFTQAVVLLPGLPWSSMFGRVGEEEFEQARAAARCDSARTGQGQEADGELEQARAVARADACSQLRIPPLRFEGRAYVDGQEVPTGRRRLTLPSGRHLVQVTRGDEVVWAQWVETVAGLEAQPGALSHRAGEEIASTLSLSAGMVLHPGPTPGAELAGWLEPTRGWQLGLNGLGLIEDAAGRPNRIFEAGLVVRRRWSPGRLEPFAGLRAARRWTPDGSSARLGLEIGGAVRLRRALRLELSGRVDLEPWSRPLELSPSIRLGVAWGR